jgi:two-component system sensor histidine kinase MtrB
VTFDWQADGASVHGDRRRLAQAFGNLLANAVQHGGGEIVIRGRPSEGGVRIEVEDAGTAAPPSRRRGARRGRGLAIAERSLEHVGARITSFDRPGGGRVAATELPVDPVR